MKLTGTGRQTGGQDHILSQADALTKNTSILSESYRYQMFCQHTYLDLNNTNTNRTDTTTEISYRIQHQKIPIPRMTLCYPILIFQIYAIYYINFTQTIIKFGIAFVQVFHFRSHLSKKALERPLL